MGKRALFVMLLISFLVRIPRFDYPLSNIFIWGDGTRDYLVANHILTNHEFPLTGPYNYFFDAGILNSPLYFYLLAFVLLPINHILVLSLLNIILQVLTLVLIFLIGKKFFNETVAILGTLTYSFNPEIINHADFVWQPNLMQPIILLGLYILIKSPNNLRFLHIALILFTLALTLHNSAFPWLPVFIIVALLILKRIRASKKQYFVTFSLMPLSLLIFHIPLLFFYITNPIFKISSINLLDTNIFSSYLPNLIANLEKFFQIFDLNKPWDFFPSENKTIGLMWLILILVTHLKPKYVFSLSLFILPIIFSAFLNKIRLHYMLLSTPIFVLLSLNLIDIFFKKTKWIKVILICFVFLIFTGNLQILKESKQPLENYHLIMDITDKISKDLEKIKLKDNYKSYNFFQVNTLMDVDYIFTYPVLDTIFLVPLEKKLNTKLATLSNTSPYNHIQTNRKDYLIIPCIKIGMDACQEEFKERNPEYSILKVIYSGSDFPVFLAKLKSLI